VTEDAIEIPEKIAESELSMEQKVKLAEGNHIWLNAMACVRPSDDFLRGVGQEIVDMLNQSPVRGDMLGVEIGRVLYVRINKS
jgi:hypothetical protein